MQTKPLLLFTLGDVAGVGPEIIARAWPQLHQICQPVVVGDPDWLRRALQLTGGTAEVVPIHELGQAHSTPAVLPCLLATVQDLSGVALDGVNANTNARGIDRVETPLNTDAIAEVTILSNNYQAEYGGTGSDANGQR